MSIPTTLSLHKKVHWAWAATAIMCGSALQPQFAHHSNSKADVKYDKSFDLTWYASSQQYYRNIPAYQIDAYILYPCTTASWNESRIVTLPLRWGYNIHFKMQVRTFSSLKQYNSTEFCNGGLASGSTWISVFGRFRKITAKIENKKIMSAASFLFWKSSSHFYQGNKQHT